MEKKINQILKNQLEIMDWLKVWTEEHGFCDSDWYKVITRITETTNLLNGKE